MSGADAHPGPEGPTPSYIYEAFTNALLDKGRYRGDAHYLFADLPILGKGAGYVRLEDYHAWESLEYDYRPPVANSKAQRRLLQAGRSILNMQLYDKSTGRYTGTSYTLCRPDCVVPDTPVGMLFYQTDDIAPRLGQPEDIRSLAIVSNKENDYAFVEHPIQDRQLMLAHLAITA